MAKRKAAAFSDIFHYDNQIDFKFGNAFNPDKISDVKTANFDDSSSSDDEDEDFQMLREQSKQWKKNDESVELSDDESLNDNEEEKDDSQNLNNSQSYSPPPPPPLDTPTIARETHKIRASKKSREVESTLFLLKQASELQSTPSQPHIGFDELIVLEDSPPSNEPRMSADRNMVVKIRTSSGVQRINIKSGEPFRKIIPEISRKENIPEDKIMLTLWGEVIDLSETPLSLGVTVADILECIVTQNDTSKEDQIDEEEGIEVKIQGGNSRQIQSFKIKMNEHLEKVMVKYCSIMGLPRPKVRFYFDGDEVNSEDTPETLDMEDESMIDVQIK